MQSAGPYVREKLILSRVAYEQAWASRKNV